LGQLTHDLNPSLCEIRRKTTAKWGTCSPPPCRGGVNRHRRRSLVILSRYEARHFARKYTRMYEKLTKCPNFTWHLAEKIDKLPNFRWFARQVFFSNFGGKCPCPPFFYAYVNKCMTMHLSGFPVAPQLTEGRALISFRVDLPYASKSNTSSTDSDSKT